MAGAFLKSLVAAGLITGLGILLGFAVWIWEPNRMEFWGLNVEKFVGICLVPVVGLVISILLSLFTTCDPLIVGHSPASRASIGAVIAMPSAMALCLQVVVLWAGLATWTLGTTPITVVTGLGLIALGGVFYKVEQNYVVGIRDLWTLRSSNVWESTHTWAYKFFILAGIGLIFLAFVVPSGIYQVCTTLGMILLPTFAAVLYSYLIRDEQYTYIVR